MLDTFEWPKPDGDADDRLLRNVREHGCQIVRIAGDKYTADYAFSIGLYLNYGQAELIVFGLDPNDASITINNIRDRAATGRTYAAGDVCDDLFVDQKVCFIEVPPACL